MTEQQMQLPEGWQWKHYGDIAELIRGVSYKKTDASLKFFSGLMPILRANNIGQNLIFDDLVYVPKKLVKSSQQILENDIIVAMSSGSKHLVGKAAQANADLSMGFGAFCANLRVNKSEQIDARYVFYFYSSKENINRISSSSSGSNINNLKREHILNAPIPIAPIQQQKQIVAKIEELFSHIDAGVESLKIAKEKLKQYRQSVLKAAVTGELTKDWRQANQDKIEPADQLLQRILKERRQRWEQQQLDQFEAKGKSPKNDKWKEKYQEPNLIDPNQLSNIPKGWLWAELNIISSKITDGEHFKPPVQSEGVYFLSAKDVRTEGVSFENPLFISEETAQKALLRCNPEYGDILIVSRGATVGRMCVVKTHERFCLLGSVILIKVIPGIDSSYLRYLLESPDINRNLSTVSGATAQQAIYLRDIQSIAIPICSLEEQQEIVRIVEEKLTAAERLMTEIDTKLTQAQQQKQTILASAFRGELV